jgi:iron complex transport system substrate-binding protein
MRLLTLVLALVLCLTASAAARQVVDAAGRTVTVPDTVRRVICSGSGCLRLLTYLQAQDLAVAVDDIEGKRSRFDARPYGLANPQFKTLPVFGGFRGQDNPELILTLDPAPQVIFKMVGTGRGTSGLDPDELQGRTGIPVVALRAGNLHERKSELSAALRLMGAVLGREARAEAVLSFFDRTMADLQGRTGDIPEKSRPAAYIGGIAYAGPHGFQSTEPGYPPFRLVNVENLAARDGDTATGGVRDISREQLIAWNPDLLFLDLSTLQLGEAAGGLHELRTDPAYRTLAAVRSGQVYGLLPYNWYGQNLESIFANAYFLGTLLHPDRFADIDPAAKADEITTFLVGKPLLAEMNRRFGGHAFRAVGLR